MQPRQDPTLLLHLPHDYRLCQLSPYPLRDTPHLRHMNNLHLQVLLPHEQIHAHAIMFLLDPAAEVVNHVAHLVLEAQHLLLYCFGKGSEGGFVGAVLVHAGEQRVISFPYVERHLPRAGSDGVVGMNGGEIGDGEEFEKLGIKHAVLSRVLGF